jgi:apolipoprotein N-acyltransferase
VRQLRASTALLLCAFAGGTSGFSIAWPWSFGFRPGQAVWLIGVFALTVLYGLIDASTAKKQVVARSVSFAIVWLGSTFWWLYVAMHRYAGLPGTTAAAAVIGLAAVLALYYVIAILIFWKWRRALGMFGPIVFSALWTAAEMARGTWFSGFGWGAIGYSQVDGPLAYYAPLVGVYGVGALALLLAGIMACRHWNLQWTAIAFSIAIGIPLLAPGRVNTWTQSTGAVGVSLLQGNIPQDEKFELGSGIPLALRWYGEQLTHSRSELTIAPETALPLLPNQLPPGYWSWTAGASHWHSIGGRARWLYELSDRVGRRGAGAMALQQTPLGSIR